MINGKHAGHVYVLVSSNCQFVKVGRTDHAPLKRIREINGQEPYRSLGPWALHDFREVADCAKVERHLHYTFRSAQVTSIPGQRELFAITAVEASTALDQIDENMLLRRPTVDRLFQDVVLVRFFLRLFRQAGLFNWLHLQGAWTLSLFPGTSGGRFYTINIGKHEVAYARTPRAGNPAIQMVCMDRLIRDFASVASWVKSRNGWMDDDAYDTALPRSTSVHFEGGFEAALEFLALDGVRRAIIAYWTEALIGLQERGKLSVYSRYHNWNGVARLAARARATSDPHFDSA